MSNILGLMSEEKLYQVFCPEDKLVKSWDEIKPTLETVVKMHLN